MDEKAYTGRPLRVLFLIAATAVFLFSVQTSSLAQRSCLAPSRVDAARAMSVSEDARVRRALEEGAAAGLRERVAQGPTGWDCKEP
jgi:hypothetical protein